MTIPKNIFQTCSDPSLLDESCLENIRQIKAMNPSWNYRLFDDRDVKNLFAEVFSKNHLELISRINPSYGVVLADIFRYVAIYKFGGVYLDIKSTIKNSLDEVIKNEHTLLLSQWRNRLAEEFPGWGLHRELCSIPGGEFMQWYLVSTQGHPMIKAVIEEVLKNISIYDPYITGVGAMGVLRLSGPILFTTTIYPMIRKYPCQLVDIQSMGFQYAISKSIHFKNRQSPRHYTNLKESIIL